MCTCHCVEVLKQTRQRINVRGRAVYLRGERFYKTVSELIDARYSRVMHEPVGQADKLYREVITVY
jgi:hypothetical protein